MFHMCVHCVKSSGYDIFGDKLVMIEANLQPYRLYIIFGFYIIYQVVQLVINTQPSYTQCFF